MNVNQRKPTVNKVGGAVEVHSAGVVGGAKRRREPTMRVMSPDGEVSTHTIYNARDLINHHGYKPVSRPHLVNNEANAISGNMVEEGEQPEDDEVVNEVSEEDEDLQPPAQEANPGADELAALRATYEKVVGKKPHHMMGKAKLQAAIDEASE